MCRLFVPVAVRLPVVCRTFPDRFASALPFKLCLHIQPERLSLVVFVGVLGVGFVCWFAC